MNYFIMQNEEIKHPENGVRQSILLVKKWKNKTTFIFNKSKSAA